MAQAYQEKLDGKISDEFRMQKSGGGGQRKNQPTYRKLFNLKCQIVETEEWCAQGDDLRIFLGDFVAAFHQIELPDRMNL